MNQDKHLFQFTGQQIADACAAEVAYRRERIAFWEADQQKQIERAQGLTAVAKVVRWEHSSGTGYRVDAQLVDIQDINERLSRAGEKIHAHRRAIEEYELKGAAYATQATRAYELDPGDVAYFKLNGAKRTE